MIKISEPLFDRREEKAIIEILRSGQLTQGGKVSFFEQKFAEFIGTKYAIAVSNGTAALHLSLLALGIAQGDEVITTPFSFIASTNAILYLGAKPVFVDINLKTFNIDPNLIEKRITSKTKAILPVHLYGLPADLKNILTIAKKYNLFVIEDAAQAHGAKINKRMIGSFGDLASFSFYSTKNMTTGEGGIITTNNGNLAKKIKMLRNHGMQEKYHHEMLGFNYRMTNMQAVLGITQLKKLILFNKKRINNAKFLTDNLININSIQTPYVPKNYTHVFHQYTILMKDGKRKRDKLSEFLNKNGVATMIYYPIPIHKQKFMQKMYPNVKMANAEHAADCILSLPIHPAVSKKDLQKITLLIKRFFKQVSE